MLMYTIVLPSACAAAYVIDSGVSYASIQANKQNWESNSERKKQQWKQTNNVNVIANICKSSN